MPSIYTTLTDNRRFKQIDWGPTQPIPGCQAHLINGNIPCSGPAEFDSPTTDGPWADLCRDHAEAFCPAGSSIGFHRVRKL